MMKLIHLMNTRLNERGSLPAVMITAMLLTITSVILAAAGVTSLKNTELQVAKDNLSKALISCHSTLSGEVLRTFVDAPVPDLASSATLKCTYPELGVQVTVVGTPEKYTPPGSTEPDSLKVTLKAVYGQNPVQPTKAETSKVRYMAYATQEDTPITENTCITGWTQDNHAIWATPCPN